MIDLKSIFPKGAKDFFSANAAIMEPSVKKNALQANVAPRRGKINTTETEFSMILEAQKRKGEILRYEFEGITLRWADMRYTPDFLVMICSERWVNRGGIEFSPCEMKMIEVKGAHIWDRDIVRFKGARAYWPEFQFELWTKTKAGWQRKY